VEEAFQSYAKPLFNFVYRLTRRADVAEDIAQECFVALLKAPNRFDPRRGSLKTYLFAIARHLALKSVRDNRARTPLDENTLFHTDDTWNALHISRIVERAVAELPPLQQEALVLFQYEGFTLEEIAQVGDVDVGAIKSRLHRAREQLRRRLAAYKGRLAVDGRA
jgi:RNA polymerase sigma-70 factor (ECF subfamily)